MVLEPPVHPGQLCTTATLFAASTPTGRRSSATRAVVNSGCWIRSGP